MRTGVRVLLQIVFFALVWSILSSLIDRRPFAEFIAHGLILGAFVAVFTEVVMRWLMRRSEARSKE